MTKQKFFEELTNALMPVDPSIRAELLADINEHFTEGASFGLSEEEICEKLGQPSQIAEQVLEEYAANKGQNSYWRDAKGESDGIKDAVGNLMSSIGDIIESATGNVKIYNMQEEVSRSFEDAMQSAKDATSRIQRDVERNMKDYTSRVKGGYEVNIDETFSGVTGMDINLGSCNVQVVPHQGPDTRLVINGTSKYNYFVRMVQNGCLIIAEKHPIVRFELFSFNPALNATIYVPAGFNGVINSSLSSGNTSIKDIRGNLNLKASSGNIYIDGHTGGTANIRTSSGRIDINNSTIGIISGTSSSGGVNLEAHETGVLKLTCSSGNMNVKAEKIGGDTQLTASSGNLRLVAREISGNITARTSSGTTHVSLPKDANCRIDVSKSKHVNKNIQVSGNPQSPYVLKLSAGSGATIIEALR